MDLDLTISKGRNDRPVVIFIHGLGMNKYFWLDPLETKIFAKNIPLKVFAASRPEFPPADKRRKFTTGDFPDSLNNIWSEVVRREFNALCWSQRRPVGPISVAVDELHEIVMIVRKTFPGKPVAFIAHSRGGLIARKFMERKRSYIRALITLATPHAGSSLAVIGKYLAPMSAVLKGVLPRNTHGRISEVVSNLTELLEGNAANELLPGSTFLNHLKDTKSDNISYLSFGGTKTELLKVYSWKRGDQKLTPGQLLTIPDSLLRVLPGKFIPDELISGKGDVLVTAKSSVMPWSDRHYNIPVNHIAIAWNEEVVRKTMNALYRM